MCKEILSESAMTKLKAILIIEFILFGSFAGAYLYLQDQGLVRGVTKSAEFTLTDLEISPSEAYIGDTIQISANLTNISEVQGNHTLSLLINNVMKDTANFTVASNSSEIVQFTDIEEAVGTYDVQVGNLNGTFTIIEAPPEASKIILSDITIDPFEVWPDDPVNVTATAHNQASAGG